MKQLLTKFSIYGPLSVLYIASLLAASCSFLSHIAWNLGKVVYIPRSEWNSWRYEYDLRAPAWLVWMRGHMNWSLWAVLVALVAPFLLAIWLGLVSKLDVKPITPRRGLRLFAWTWMISSVGWWILVMWSPTGSP